MWKLKAKQIYIGNRLTDTENTLVVTSGECHMLWHGERPSLDVCWGRDGFLLRWSAGNQAAAGADLFLPCLEASPCVERSHCPPGSCGGPSTSQRGEDVRQLKLSFFDESVNCYQHFGKLFSIIYHNCKEIQPVHPKDQSWVFIGRTDAEAETPILWPPHVKSWLIGKDPDAGRDWGQEEKGTTEDEMAGWRHRLDGHEFK